MKQIAAAAVAAAVLVAGCSGNALADVGYPIGKEPPRSDEQMQEAIGEPAAVQHRSITVSNVVYSIEYRLHSTKSYGVPLTSPLGQPHYGCTAQVWKTNEIKTFTVTAGPGTLAVALIKTNIVEEAVQVGGPIETEWTVKGCFEDDPMHMVGRALGWTRYPNDSAGKGRHIVIEGAAEWSEFDDPKQQKEAIRDKWTANGTNNTIGNAIISITNMAITSSSFYTNTGNQIGAGEQHMFTLMDKYRDHKEGVFYLEWDGSMLRLYDANKKLFLSTSVPK